MHDAAEHENTPFVHVDFRPCHQHRGRVGVTKDVALTCWSMTPDDVSLYVLVSGSCRSLERYLGIKNDQVVQDEIPNTTRQNSNSAISAC